MECPPISCVCPTYGRVHLLEESIQSFLRQDYKGKKQLVIVNDFPHQQLFFDHPEVKIINSPPLKNLGQVRNLSVELADYDLIANWDDDDIYLPHSLSMRVKYMRSEFSKFAWAFFSIDNVLEKIDTNVFHSQAIYTKKLFNKIGGYLEMNAGEDIKFEDAIQNKFIYHEKNPHELHYIYRWGNFIFHLSGLGFNNLTAKEQMTKFIINKIKEGIAPEGKIVLKPKWNKDYVTDIKYFIEK